MSYSISDNHRMRLRTYVMQGAHNYDQYLKGKVFRVICLDGDAVEVKFFKKDFKHLTGIESPLSEDEFYARCLDGTLAVTDINGIQKYDFQTLRKKGAMIENIHFLLYQDNEKTLLLKELKVHTTTFPVAIRDEINNICVGFVSSQNKARSLRKANNSHDTKHEKSIIAIWARNAQETCYDELVYQSDAGVTYIKREMETNCISDKLREAIEESVPTVGTNAQEEACDVTPIETVDATDPADYVDYVDPEE